MSMPSAALELLRTWILRAAPPDGAVWFDGALPRMRKETGAARARLVSLAGRRLGRAPLDLGARDLADAAGIRPGWQPAGLGIDQAALIALMIAGYTGADAAFAEELDRLCRTADAGEIVACYRGLPVFPAAEHLIDRAREGARSSIEAVFEAVALRNPYPAERFDTPAWNQLVLKAVFIGSPLDFVDGLDARANGDLAMTLIDYARERRAAGRAVSDDVWRCVRPFVDERDIARLLQTSNQVQA
jgi:hypothetical protein